jgi:hypothetical protein
VSDQQEQIPTWAIELIKQVERLNEKIPTHIDWVEKNLSDHERRIRFIERWFWMIIAGSSIFGGLIGTWLQQIIGK